MNAAIHVAQYAGSGGQWDSGRLAMGAAAAAYKRATEDAEWSTIWLGMRGIPYVGVADACRLASQMASVRLA
ncbi:MAG: hypothetical protein EBR82_41990 [Caulobacteraceae bacterium]|nr:hypothetical protein [Caulobacteraceae bacterium]